MASPIEVIAQDNNVCGEGPIWDERRSRLIWNDMESLLVYQYVPATGEKGILAEGVMASGIALQEDGTLLFAGANGMHIWRGPDDYTTFMTEHDGEKLFYNDIVAAPAGRLYANTMFWGADGMEKHGKLYLVETDGSARILDEGLSLANGMGFSPDERTLYLADSTERKIYAYDVDAHDGSVSNKRVFVTVPKEEGLPDGLTVDSAGNVWSAQWYGGQVVVYDPAGEVLKRVAVPALQSSSVAFAGPDLTDVYITSASGSWEGPYAPPGYNFQAPNIGGDLYRTRNDIPGKLEYRTNISPK